MARACRPHLWPLALGFLGACTSASGVPDCRVPSPDPSTSPGVVQRIHPPAPAAEVAFPDRFERRERVEFQIILGTEAGPPSGRVPLTMTRAQLRSEKLPGEEMKATFIGLNQHPPRLVKDTRLTVADLLNEDEELAPGEHAISFIEVVNERHVKVSIQPFFLDVEVNQTPKAAGCTVVTQRLTFNGPKAANEVDILVVPLEEGIDEVTLSASSRDYRSEATLVLGQQVRMSDAPSGDVLLEAQCLRNGVVVSKVERSIVINRDAPEETFE